MDFIVAFLLGYFFKDAVGYLKRIADNSAFDREFRTIVELDEEWHSDDLP